MPAAFAWDAWLLSAEESSWSRYGLKRRICSNMASVSTIRSLSGAKPGSGRISTAEDSAGSDFSVGCEAPIRPVVFVAVAVFLGSVAKKSGTVESESETEPERDADMDTAVAVVVVPVRRKAGGC